MDLPQSIVEEILLRLPLKSIARCKSVCKEWKTLFESTNFRDLYLSMNQNSTSSWSFMSYGTVHLKPREVASQYECRTWGLNKPIGSYISLFKKDKRIKVKESGVLSSTIDGLVLIYTTSFDDEKRAYYVGYPVLRQWVEVPCPPRYPTCSTDEFELVTCMDRSVLLGYKVVQVVNEFASTIGCLKFKIYSSDTGEWIRKRLLTHRAGFWYISSRPICLNGKLHWHYCDFHSNDHRGIMSYDFFSSMKTDEERCRFTPFPKTLHNLEFDISTLPKRVCSSSREFIMYMEKAFRNAEEILTVWKLNCCSNDLEEWQLLLMINTSCIGLDIHLVPVAVHPFDIDTIYLWSYTNSCMISGNIQTLKFTFHKEDRKGDESHGIIQRFSDCTEEVMAYYGIEEFSQLQCFQQCVLPQWLEPIPRSISSPYMPVNVLSKSTQLCYPFKRIGRTIKSISRRWFLHR